MLLDFNARGRLIRPMSLSIRFLFVRLRFRYCFFSPIPHDMNLASRFRVRRKLRPLWTFTTDERHARHTTISGRGSPPAVCLSSIFAMYLGMLLCLIAKANRTMWFYPSIDWVLTYSHSLVSVLQCLTTASFFSASPFSLNLTVPHTPFS